MFCPQCGTSVKDGAKFCPQCGHQFSQTAGVGTNAPGYQQQYQPQQPGFQQPQQQGYQQAQHPGQPQQPGAGQAYGAPQQQRGAANYSRQNMTTAQYGVDQQKVKIGKILGIASIVVAAIGLILSFAAIGADDIHVNPYITGAVLGGVSIALAIIGIYMSRGKSKVFAIIGIVIAVIALILGIYMASYIYSYFGGYYDEAIKYYDALDGLSDYL